MKMSLLNEAKLPSLKDKIREHEEARQVAERKSVEKVEKVEIKKGRRLNK